MFYTLLLVFLSACCLSVYVWVGCVQIVHTVCVLAWGLFFENEDYFVDTLILILILILLWLDEQMLNIFLGVKRLTCVLFCVLSVVRLNNDVHHRCLHSTYKNAIKCFINFVSNRHVYTISFFTHLICHCAFSYNHNNFLIICIFIKKKVLDFWES